MSPEIVLKSTIVLVAGWAAGFALHRSSPDSRHLAWTAALGAALLLPPLSRLLPEWTWTPPAWTTIEAFVSGTFGGREPDELGSALSRLWLAGLVAVAGWYLVGRSRLARLARMATPLDGDEWAGELDQARETLGITRPVRLLASSDATTPMTWGILRPVVLLPTGACGRPPAYRRAVLLHELAHLRRGDYLSQAVTWASCAAYWFHPLAWWGARRSWAERERACDEAVLRAGVPAAEYAAHLLTTERCAALVRPSDAAVVRLAHFGVQERMVAALAFDPQAPRSSRAARTIIPTTFAVLVLTLAAHHPVPEAAEVLRLTRHQVAAGDVELENVRGPILASTGRGDIRISGASSDVVAWSADGDVEIRLSPSTRRRSVGVTAVGDLRLYLPDGEGITVDLYATRAEDRPSDPDIHTPWSRLRTVDESGGVRSTGVIGDGRTKVHMHAIGGDIHVLRLPAPDESG